MKNEPVEIFIARRRLFIRSLLTGTLFILICGSVIFYQSQNGFYIFGHDFLFNLIFLGLIYFIGFLGVLGFFIGIREEILAKSNKENREPHEDHFFRVFYADDIGVKIRTPYGKKTRHRWGDIQALYLTPYMKTIRKKSDYDSHYNPPHIVLLFETADVEGSVDKGPDGRMYAAIKIPRKTSLEGILTRLSELENDDTQIAIIDKMTLNFIEGSIDFH